MSTGWHCRARKKERFADDALVRYLRSGKGRTIVLHFQQTKSVPTQGLIALIKSTSALWGENMFCLRNMLSLILYKYMM